MGKSHKVNIKYGESNDKRERGQKFAKKTKRKDSSDAQLAELLKQDGFEIHYMIGDGNCLFRSVAHQLTGNPNLHPEFRDKVIRYIKRNKEHFCLFLEDDENFNDYVERMKVSGEWGGHLELYALTQCCNVTIVIHQLDSPNYKLPAADPHSKIEIHLSYHGECHYNSVKRFDDLSTGVSGWQLDDIDELGVSSNNTHQVDSRKKTLSVSSVATVSTRRPLKSKLKNKVTTSSSIDRDPSSDVVTYESLKDDYVLVSVDHEEQSPAPSDTVAAFDNSSVSSEATSALPDALGALSAGLGYVYSALGSLSLSATGSEAVTTETPKVDEPAPSSEKPKSVPVAHNDVLTTRSGRPMSKKVSWSR